MNEYEEYVIQNFIEWLDNQGLIVQGAESINILELYKNDMGFSSQ